MRLNRLFDFYAPLLTDKQKEYMTLYYHEDYSLAEIATYAHVSRQAVYDNLKRTEQTLENYEKKLQLYATYKQRNDLLNELQDLVNKHATKHEQLSMIQQIKDLS